LIRFCYIVNETVSGSRFDLHLRMCLMSPLFRKGINKPEEVVVNFQEAKLLAG